MSNRFILEPGKTYYPPKQEVTVTEDRVKGSWWSVWKEEDQYKFEFLASRQGGGTDTYIITQGEFDAVKAGSLTVEDLIKRYDV